MKFKRILSLGLVLGLSVGMLAGCGSSSSSSNPGTDGSKGTENQSQGGTDESQSQGGDVTKQLPEMTKDEITLTYMNFDHEDLTKYLAEEFTKIYPNIHVEVIYYPAGGIDNVGYNDALYNQISTGNAPDCFMFLGNVDFMLNNAILGDMTEYWENDPENENLLPSIEGAKIGYFGSYKMSTPMKFFPDAIYAELGAYEALNVELPSADWTWDEMVEKFKATTGTANGLKYYGFNQFHNIVTYYPLASDPNTTGEFGFDGTKFDMTNWAKGTQALADLTNGGYIAPQTAEERTAWVGADVWAAYTGQLGHQVDAFWTYLNLFNTPEYRDKGMEWIMLPSPSVEGAEESYKFGVLDMGGISTATEHPREAYELLKFMGWGVEGWKAKLKAYETMLDSAGNPIWTASMPAPITMDEDIWKEYQTTFFPTEMEYDASSVADVWSLVSDETVREGYTRYPKTDLDAKYGKYFDAYFEQVKQGCIPYGDTQIPGFATFIAEQYWGDVAVETQIANGQSTASDWVEPLTTLANQYYHDALQKMLDTYQAVGETWMTEEGVFGTK